MKNISSLVFVIICTVYSCKVQNVIPPKDITTISKSQDKLYLLRTIEKCNILKGGLPLHSGR